MKHSSFKDLFFEGLTATIFIFMLLSWNSPGGMVIFGIIAIFVAILLLIQHTNKEVIKISPNRVLIYH